MTSSTCRSSRFAPIIDRSEPAAGQLASRARRRLRTTATPDTDLAAQWQLVDAFLAAAREGDFDALLAVLDPDVVRRVDTGATDPGVPRILRGAQAVATGAIAFNRLGHVARRALVNGAPGMVALADGKPYAVLGFTIARGKIIEINVLADPELDRQPRQAHSPRATRRLRVATEVKEMSFGVVAALPSCTLAGATAAPTSEPGELPSDPMNRVATSTRPGPLDGGFR
jgi:hypothetical protein